MDLGLETAAVVDVDDLDEQHRLIAGALPERPVVLGGCCCTHVGAGRGLAQRHGRIAVVWFDAHGDLNTPETSPSGNLWGMPFRMLLDGGGIAVEDAALIGARNLDPPEDEFIERVGLATSPGELDGVLDGVVGAYIALDCDVLDPKRDRLLHAGAGWPVRGGRVRVDRAGRRTGAGGRDRPDRAGQRPREPAAAAPLLRGRGRDFVAAIAASWSSSQRLRSMPPP